MTGSASWYRWSLLAMVGVFGLSWALYHVTHGTMLGLFGLGIGLAFVSWRHPRWLAYASIAELVIGGKGYILSWTVGTSVLSLREVLFALLMIRSAGWLWQFRREMIPGGIRRPWIWFVVWLALMAGWGLIRQNGYSNTWFDANGFLAVGYLPLWWLLLRTDPDWRNRTWSIVLAGSSAVAILSLVIVYCFGHNVSFVSPLYHWVRDTGLGEITWINGNVYRVFLQSQLYCVIVLAVMSVAVAMERLRTWQWWPIALAGIGTYVSLSRSFWLGLGAGVLVAVIVLIKQRAARWWALSVLVPIALLAWLANSWATNFPKVFGQGTPNALIARLTSSQSTQAATARVNQIHPLLNAIKHHPIIGNGFGTTITYYSTDPRIRGWRTTSAFELGYLDLWLKLGVIGVVVFGWWIWAVSRGLICRSYWPWLIGCVALMVTHATTPYLNHPIGISWLCLLSLYAYA